MELKEKDFKGFFNAFGSAMKADIETGFAEVADDELFVKATQLAKNGDYESFHAHLIYPFTQTVEALLTRVTSSNEAQFLIEKGNFVARFFEKMFTENEGVACCADKARAIVRALINFYMTGERIEFNYDAEYTFHLPKKIFKDHDSIIEYFEGIYSIYYGNHDKYVRAVSNIINSLKDK